MADRPPRQPTRAHRDSAALLHRGAIRLLRRVRSGDGGSGLTPPRASALSVLVFAGPMTLGDLARAEQVRPPTISRLVRDMERDDLVRLEPDAADGRIKRVHATARGKRLMLEARDRRVERIATALAGLPREQGRLLARAAELLEQLTERA